MLFHAFKWLFSLLNIMHNKSDCAKFPNLLNLFDSFKTQAYFKPLLPENVISFTFKLAL